MTHALRKFCNCLLLVAAAFALVMPVAASAGPSAEEISKLPLTKKNLLGLYLYSSEVPSFLVSLKGHYLFIDLRNTHEVLKLGTPAQTDANIPFENPGRFVIPWGEVEVPYDQRGTSDFSTRVDALAASKGLGKNTPVILICNHGEHSAMAADVLAWHGYTLVYSILDGFEGDHVANRNVRNNGWIGNHLPLKNSSLRSGEAQYGQLQ